jgi:hypothetical protein
MRVCVNTPIPHPLVSTAHLSLQQFSVTIALLYFLVTCFSDFGDYCGLLLRVTKLLGDWGIMNVIVMWYK